MGVVMGPILGFRGADKNSWKLSAIVVVDGANPTVSVTVKSEDGTPVPGAVNVTSIEVARLDARRVVRFDWSVARDGKARLVDYSVSGDPRNSTYRVVVPGRDEVLRFGYASCNGFSHPKYMKGIDDQNAQWTHMRARHDRAPLHLLLMGGDQVYGDELWSRVAVFRDWLDLSKKARRTATAPGYAKDAEAFYFDLYARRWNQDEPAYLFARVPSLMMWDDHDIFDGWGSYDDETQDQPVYKDIFREATKAFRAFQLRANPTEPIEGGLRAQNGLAETSRNFSYRVVIDKVGILALDLRSERTRSQVMSDTSWKKVYDWLDGDETKGLRQLLVLSSIPVVYPRLTAMEKLFDIVPGHQELEDDLKDHWTSRPHGEERERMLRRLFAFADRERCRVTILSGDVHVAALGAVESTGIAGNAGVINQLISSAIVHSPPPTVACLMLQHMARKEDEISRGLVARMLSFSGTTDCIVARRNWLDLEVDTSHRLWASWWVEGEDDPYRKVVHPV